MKQKFLNLFFLIIHFTNTNDIFDAFDKSIKKKGQIKRKNKTGFTKHKNENKILHDLQKHNKDIDKILNNKKIIIVDGKIFEVDNDKDVPININLPKKNNYNPNEIMKEFNNNGRYSSEEDSFFRSDIITKIKKVVKKTKNVVDLFSLKVVTSDPYDNFDFFGKKGKRIKNKEISDYERYKQTPIISVFNQESYINDKLEKKIKEKNQKFNDKEKINKQLNEGKKDKIGNLDLNSDFRPIQILYELKFLKIQLAKIGKSNLFNDFKQLLRRCDMIFKRYLKINKNVNQKIKIPKLFDGCQASNSAKTEFNFDAKNFQKDTSFNADLVILVSAYIDGSSNTIASALPCLKDNNSSRATVGRINFNIPKMSLDLQDSFQYKESLHTTIHELFHVLAFHESIQTNFENKVDNKSPHLLKLAQFYKRNKNKLPNPNDAPIPDNSHWNPLYIQNDLMVPTSKVDSILSIFSLEYVDIASSDLTTDMTKVSNNYLLDSVIKEDYWSYKCPSLKSGKRSKYPFVCSLWEFHNDKFGCSVDYQSKAVCSKILNSTNNCMEKQIFSEGDCRNTKAKQVYTFEKFGERSRCFKLEQGYSTACLNFKIVGKEIQIEIQNKTFVCKNGITEVKIEFKKNNDTYNDKIRCPDFEDFNKELDNTSCPYNCNFNGVCIKGVCDCYGGWDPKDNCSSRLAGSSTYSTYFLDG